MSKLLTFVFTNGEKSKHLFKKEGEKIFGSVKNGSGKEFNPPKFVEANPKLYSARFGHFEDYKKRGTK